MMLNGRTLASLGIATDATYIVPAVAPVVAIIVPWQRGCVTYVPLTVDQQIELATSEALILPLLCWGPGGAHTHDIALMQRG